MKVKSVFAMLLVCTVMMSSLRIYAGAIETVPNTEKLSIQRASGRFSMDISGNTLKVANQVFSLEAGESVTIRATYSPASASMDFGVIGPDGLFYSVNVTDGSVDQEIEAGKRGSYTLAIRNNSSQTVSVSGYVNY